jgi:hypothetical protein
MSLVNHLFDLISVNEKNEKEILDLLEKHRNDQNIQEILNEIPDDDYEESMLMWAVWRIKIDVVKKLVEMGADLKYSNSMEESVSTYWDDDEIKKDENKACELAQYLHGKGVDLSERSMYSWSLLKRSKDNKHQILLKKLKELGY